MEKTSRRSSLCQHLQAELIPLFWNRWDRFGVFGSGNTYTRRFNTRHRQWGRLFGDRYKAVLVEGSGYYYETLLDYVHLNPVRAGLVNPQAGQSVMDFPWSSVAGGYALSSKDSPGWLASVSGLEVFGCADTVAGRQSWVKRLDRRAEVDDGRNGYRWFEIGNEAGIVGQRRAKGGDCQLDLGEDDSEHEVACGKSVDAQPSQRESTNPPPPDNPPKLPKGLNQWITQSRNVA